MIRSAARTAIMESWLYSTEAFCGIGLSSLYLYIHTFQQKLDFSQCLSGDCVSVIDIAHVSSLSVFVVLYISFSWVLCRCLFSARLHVHAGSGGGGLYPITLRPCACVPVSRGLGGCKNKAQRKYHVFSSAGWSHIKSDTGRNIIRSTGRGACRGDQFNRFHKKVLGVVNQLCHVIGSSEVP